MENKHTPEPWRLHEDVQDGQFMIAMATSIDHSGSYEPQHRIEWDYGLYPQDGDQYEEGKANAERIVACVNALAGIEDPEKWVKETITTLVFASEELGRTGCGEGEWMYNLLQKINKAIDLYNGPYKEFREGKK